MGSCLTEVLGSRSGALNDKRAVDRLISAEGKKGDSHHSRHIIGFVTTRPRSSCHELVRVCPPLP